MDRKVKDAFDPVKMPDACIQRIENAIDERRREENRSDPIKWKRALSAAAALVLVIIAVLNIPVVAKSLELAALAISDALEVFFSDYVMVSDGHQEIVEFRVDQDGNIIETVVDSFRVFPEWMIEVDGRLYFVAHEEYIDITDSFTKDKPFTYVYDDLKSGGKYCYAVGGAFDPEKHIADSAMGWFEWFIDESGMCSGGGNLNDFVYMEPETTWVYHLEEAWDLQRNGLNIHFDELREAILGLNEIAKNGN